MASAWRLIFMAMPDAATRRRLMRSFEATGQLPVLGDAFFDSACWHQSLSDRVPYSEDLLRELMEVGSMVEASPFVLTLDRLDGSRESKPYHWALKARSKPKGLENLLKSIKRCRAAKGIPDDTGHTAHVSVSYWAQVPAPKMRVSPVCWTIDEFMLVRGGGEPYRYEVLHRWPLTAKPEHAGGQFDLFGTF